MLYQRLLYYALFIHSILQYITISYHIIAQSLDHEGDPGPGEAGAPEVPQDPEDLLLELSLALLSLLLLSLLISLSLSSLLLVSYNYYYVAPQPRIVPKTTQETLLSRDLTWWGPRRVTSPVSATQRMITIWAPRHARCGLFVLPAAQARTRDVTRQHASAMPGTYARKKRELAQRCGYFNVEITTCGFLVQR